MMTIRENHAALHKAVARVCKIVDRKARTPILRCIRLYVGSGTLSIAAARSVQYEAADGVTIVQKTLECEVGEPQSSRGSTSEA